MATNDPIHNGIQYYGIATYENVNEGAHDKIFIDVEESIKRCLSKQVADEYTTDFTYNDDDLNGGKLLKYSSLIFLSTIPIVIKNNTNSYNVSLEQCIFTFSEEIDGEAGISYKVQFPASVEYFDSGQKKEFSVRNDRKRMTIPNSFNGPGTITLQILIVGQMYDEYYRPVNTNKNVRCGFSYVRNNSISQEYVPKIIQSSGGMFTYNCDYELSWINSNIGSDVIEFSGELDTVWPNDAEKFQIQIYTGA